MGRSWVQFVVVGVLTVGAMLWSATCRAESKVRPVVCLDFRQVGEGQAVCSDGKKPFLMSGVTLVTLQGPDGAVRAAVGWR